MPHICSWVSRERLDDYAMADFFSDPRALDTLDHRVSDNYCRVFWLQTLGVVLLSKVVEDFVPIFSWYLGLCGALLCLSFFLLYILGLRAKRFAVCILATLLMFAGGRVSCSSGRLVVPSQRCHQAFVSVTCDLCFLFEGIVLGFNLAKPAKKLVVFMPQLLQLICILFAVGGEFE